MAALIQRLDILYSFSWHHITLRHKSEAGCNNLQLPGRVKPWQCGLNTIWVKAACLIGSPSTILNIYSPHHWRTIAAVPAVCKISSSYSTRLFWQLFKTENSATAQVLSELGDSTTSKDPVQIHHHTIVSRKLPGSKFWNCFCATCCNQKDCNFSKCTTSR